MIHIVFMSRTISVGGAFRLDAATDLAKRLLGRRQGPRSGQAATLEHRPGRGRQGRPLEDLEGMKNGGRANLEEDVPHALLGHVERLRRVEDALVKRRQAVEVTRLETSCGARPRRASSCSFLHRNLARGWPSMSR